jgi:hypothetical protein
VDHNACGAIRFTRPDGRIVDEHPRLLASGDIGSFRDLISGEGEPPIDASGWIIPEGVMDLDLAVSGLMRLEESQTPLVERPS